MESYLDNRAKEVKLGQTAESFSLPELSATKTRSSSEKTSIASNVERSESRDVPRFDPEAIQNVPIELESLPEGKRPKVQLVMANERVSHVIITCSCGECVELECNY